MSARDFAPFDGWRDPARRLRLPSPAWGPVWANAGARPIALCAAMPYARVSFMIGRRDLRRFRVTRLVRGGEGIRPPREIRLRCRSDLLRLRRVALSRRTHGASSVG